MATATSLPSQNAQLRDSISRLIASSRSRSAGHMAMWHNHACTSDLMPIELMGARAVILAIRGDAMIKHAIVDNLLTSFSDLESEGIEIWNAQAAITLITNDAISDVILARYALELLPGAAAFLPATAGTKVRATLVEAFIGTFSNVIGASADYDEVGALANLAEFLIIHSELGSLNAAFNMPEVAGNTAGGTAVFAFDVVLRSGLTGYSNPSLVRAIQNTIRAQNVPVRALPMNLGGIYLTNGGHLTDCDKIPSSEPHRPLFTATATLGGYSVVVQTAATSRKSGLKETKEAAVRVLLTDIDVITEEEAFSTETWTPIGTGVPMARKITLASRV